MGVGASAQAAVGISVLSPTRTVSTGEVAIHVFALTNPGPVPTEVSLGVVLPLGWQHLGLPLTLSLGPGDEETVFLAVVVPGTAAAGEYGMSLVLTWPGGEATAAAVVRVLSVAGVALVPPPPGEGQPGGSVPYELGVVNRGNVLDRFAVDVSSTGGWPVRVEPREFTLRPGEPGIVRVVHAIPAQAEPGRDLLAVVVRSQEGAEARAAWFTTVLPPGPEAIVGTVLSELEMTLGLRLGYDAISSRRMSLLTLTGHGEVLGGGVELLLHLTGPWELVPYRLARFSFGYEGDTAWVKAGEVDLNLSGLLLGLGAAGMAAGIATDHGQAALITGWVGGEGRFGLRGCWSGSWGELGLAFRETRGTGAVRAGTLWIAGRLGEGVVLRGEGGLALAGPYLDAGFGVGIAVDGGSQPAFEAEAYAVGPHVPSPRADRAGVRLSGNVEVESVGLRFVTRWERDNVLGITTFPTVVRMDLSTALDWFPLEGMGVSSSATLLRSEGFGPGLNLNRKTGILGLIATLGEAPLVVRVSGRWRWEEDLAASSRQWTAEYGERFALTLGRTKATLTLSQAVSYDGAGVLLSAANQVGLSVHTSAGIAIDFRYSRDGGSVGIDFPFAVPPALSAVARVEAQWGALGEARSLFGSIGFEYSFLWTPPFLPSKGWLEGTVFVDDNRNGRFDPGEEAVANAVLVADEKRVASGADGRFLFPPLPPGTYALALERLPGGFRSRTALPLQITVELAGRKIVHLPCERVGAISGVVYSDGDQNETRTEDEPGLGRVRVVLERGEAVVAETFTTPVGSFSFPDLPAGTYRVRADPDTLPERHELTTPVVVEVGLAAGASAEVLFGAWPKPRPVVVVYRPPVADFAWTPSSPRAGESVAFDAGASLGQVVRYQWDFTGDRAFDAEGLVVTWTFAEPGLYLVTLLVIDDVGLDGEATLLVHVAP